MSRHNRKQSLLPPLGKVYVLAKDATEAGELSKAGICYRNWKSAEKALRGLPDPYYRSTLSIFEVPRPLVPTV